MVLTRLRTAIARRLHQLGDTTMPPMQAAGYRAARNDQWSGDWLFGASSMAQILRADLPMLRDKARDLVMNNATAARIPTLFSENVSGKDGIIYQAAVASASGEPDKETNKALEAAWYRWAEDHTAVSADRRLNWQEIEQLTDESECTDGETLVRLLPGFKNKWRFAVQVLDPDQLDISLNEEAGRGRNAIVMGVEIDEWGAPVVYHLWPNHPSEVQRRGERIKVPASQMLHTFLMHRTGQGRGVPWLAPVIADLMHIGKYREAEVIAARVCAAKMGFIKGGLNAGTGPDFIDAVPGAFPRLGVDEELVPFDPQHPNGNYDAFDRAVMRSTASALRVSYMSLSGDLSATSFSSGQMGYLGEKNVYRTLQQRRILRYSRPVHREWLQFALLSGQLDVRGDITALSAAHWRPRSFQPIDGLKAANTDAINLALGKTTLTDLIESDGGDLREVFTKRKAEIELAKEMGIPLFLPTGFADPDAEQDEAPANQPQSQPSRGNRAAMQLERVA